ncbi:hypothetical protein FHS85_004687 [Rhodoligotrophos appendicifer]|uniref:anti-sigma factor family protein n=1 Tax=Rhodoligotrophos appendicifer TaxID=987056 RepID=UPI0011872BEB|nr:hypothetical protein [Rhodoligotrophos appendicifer]
MSQGDFSDEILMAYADGELESSVAQDVESAVGENPEIARRILGFVRSRRATKSVYASQAADPVPAVLEAAIKTRLESPNSLPGTYRPITTPPANDASSNRRTFWPIAAAVALVLGGAMGAVIDRASVARTPGAGLLAGLEASEIQDQLSRLPTGSQDATAIGTLRPLASYKTEAGTLCRWFSLEGASSNARAVACLDQRRWTLALVDLRQGSNNDYKPASDDNGPVEAFLQSIRAGAPLDRRAEEGELLLVNRD